MNKIKLLGALMLLSVIVNVTGASAATDRTQTVNAGETASWTTTAATGVNTGHFTTDDEEINPETCGKDAQNYCDTTLLVLNNPVPDTDADGRLRKTATIKLTDFAPIPGPVADFDLKVYESDAEGTKGQQVNVPWTTATPPDHEESVSITVQTETADPTEHYLLEVIYFATVNGATKVSVQF